ncbi:MAG TPA: RNA-binding S4 domain-containing protein [Aliiroseovarius sp.]|nr:RNA-binding S4 domain-containing protein [Aliiroseovarius sp.]
MADLPDKIRADKWLWHARFFKSRALAAKVIAAGHLRVDGQKVLKPAHSLRPGATLTFLQARRVRVVRIEALSTRRGPAPEAQALYQDLTPEQPVEPAAPGHDGAGRPSRKDRRSRARFEQTALE